MSRQSQIANRKENQSFGILVENLKNGYNGSLIIRSSSAFGASYVGWSGTRYKDKGVIESADTEGFRFKHPIFAGVDNLKSLIPYKSVCVAVEICDGATNIFDFEHPKVATYLFGSEDNSLSKEYLDICEHKIYIPTVHCLNVAHCTSAVMMHRMSQMIKLTDDVIKCNHCGANHYIPIDDSHFKCNACGKQFTKKD